MTINETPRVIVGVDESLAGLRALRFAVAEARRRQAMLLAVRTWSTPLAWPPGPVEPVWVGEMAQQAEAEVHRAFATAMVKAPHDVDVRVASVEGAPGPELVRLADRDDDLLVVGSRQRTLFGRMWHGSTARYCVSHASCPVLVVPPHAMAKAGSERALSRQLHREAQRLVDAA
jgi:nucleotide-binding universal stress UspA family protein